MTLKVSWPQALAWRLDRHLLDPIGNHSVEQVVDRLCGVQAQVASSAEMAVRVRQLRSTPGEVGQALADGRLIKTWAMRGTLHYLTPQLAGNFLSLMASGKSWHSATWQRYFGLTPVQIEGLRDIVRGALDGRVLTREELIEHVTARPRFKHIGEALRSGWGTVLKPLAWQGDLVFGPSRGTRVTFMSPRAASKDWAAMPDVEAAAPAVIDAYLGAYGPATAAHLSAWMSRGVIKKRRLNAWFADMGHRLTAVELDGEAAFIRSEDAHTLAAAKPSNTVRLLAGFDQWVLGPGTDDPHVIAPPRRTAVSKQSGWIAPIVVVGGVVTGTWDLDKDDLSIAWFKEAGKPPARKLAKEADRLSGIIGRPLQHTVALV